VKEKDRTDIPDGQCLKAKSWEVTRLQEVKGRDKVPRTEMRNAWLPSSLLLVGNPASKRCRRQRRNALYRKKKE
jgi:hypothetical protein